MAIVWGSPTSSSGGTVVYLGVDFATSTGTTYQTVRPKIYLKCTSGSVTDNYNVLTLSGDVSATVNNVDGTIYAGQQKLIYDGTAKSITRQYGSNTPVKVTATLSNYFPGTISATATQTVPARAYSTPTRPSFASVGGGGSSVALTWVNYPTTAAPYTKLELSRSINGGNYSVIKTWTGSLPTSYSEYNLQLDSEYKYRLRAYNSSGWSAYGYSASKYTTPSAPTGLSAARSGGTAILTLQNASRVATGVTVEVYTGGAWVGVAAGSTDSSFSYLVPVSGNFRFRAKSIVGTGESDWSYSDWVYRAPSAPSAVTAESLTANSHRIAITPGSATGESGVTYAILQSKDGGTPVTVYRGGATQYTISSVADGSSYLYSAVENGSGGSSPATAAPAPLYTRPAKPSDLRISKSGTRVTLTWVGAATADRYEIHRLYEGGFWAALNTGVSGTSYSDTPDASKRVKYRVRSEVDSPASSGYLEVTSDFVESDLLQLLAPPLAPRVVADYPAVDVNEGKVSVRVTHNPVDSSEMSTVAYRWREVGATSWYQETKSVAGYEHIAFPYDGIVNGKTYEFQAQTQGAHASFGPWSTSILFRTSTTPLAGISSPTATLDTSSLVVQLTFSDPDSTFKSADIKITRGGKPFYEKRGLSSLRHALPLPIPEGAYSITATVTDSAGLQSRPVTRAFTVTYAKPSAPLVTSTWDEDGGVTLDFDAGRTALVDAWHASERVELFPGGSFEGFTPPLTPGYGSWEAKTVSDAIDGSVVAQFTPDASQSYDSSARFGDIDVIPGHTYRIGIWARVIGTALSGRVGMPVYIWDSAGRYYFKGWPPSVFVPATSIGSEWTLLVGDMTIDPDIVRITPRIYASRLSIASGSSIQYDGASIYDVTELLPLENSIGTVDATSVTITKGDQLLAEGLPVVSSFRDPIPALPGETYTVSAVSDIPSSASTVHQAEPYNLEREWVFLNGGDSFRDVAKLRVEPAVDVQLITDRSTVEMDGRSAPLEFSGSQSYLRIGLTGRVSGDGRRLDRLGDWQSWLRVARFSAPLIYRDWVGNFLRCSIELGRISLADSPHAGISVTLTEVDDEE